LSQFFESLFNYSLKSHITKIQESLESDFSESEFQETNMALMIGYSENFTYARACKVTKILTNKIMVIIILLGRRMRLKRNKV
jgi:hypothetical protein